MPKALSWERAWSSGKEAIPIRSDSEIATSGGEIIVVGWLWD